MDASIISALAALTGAAVGGLTSGIANWLNHRSQVRAQWLLHEKSRRQILYRDFIEEASKCYIDALQHAEADIPGLIGLYAKLSRMRALSSKTVVHCAEDVARKILDTYLEPDKSFVELREMAVDGTIDLLQGFSDACHDEFEGCGQSNFELHPAISICGQGGAAAKDPREADHAHLARDVVGNSATSWPMPFAAPATTATRFLCISNRNLF